MRKISFGVLLGLMVLILSACEKSSADILDKAAGVSSAKALKEAIAIRTKSIKSARWRTGPI